MTVFFDKARGRWRYDFEMAKVRHAKEAVDAHGVPVTSRRAAIDVEAEAKRMARIAPKLRRAIDLTVAEVMDKVSDGWLNTIDLVNKRRMAIELIAFFKPETIVRDIDEARIEDYKTAVLNKPILVWKGGPTRDPSGPDAEKYWLPPKKPRVRSFSTANKHFPIARSMFERAYNTRDPVTRERAIEAIPVIKDFPEPKRKARPVPDEVLSEVMTTVPAHITEAILGTLYFGFRRDEIFHLEIPHVDFQFGGIRLENDEVKNDEDAFMPGSRDAMQFLARLVDQARARNTTRLITWRRTYKDPKRQAEAPWLSIKSPKRSWGTAMKRIEKKFGKRWRWHDIRAAFITHVALTSGGVVAQKLARHADFDTTRAYIDVADEVARAGAERASERPALGVVKGGKL